MTWRCPDCGRSFGRQNQAHECTPAMTLDEYFSTGPSFERPVFEVVREHLQSVGPVIIEAVSVGILFKRSRTFVELRPKQRWVALSFWLSHAIDDSRVARRIRGTGVRTCHVVNVRRPEDVDERVRDWLTESYLDSPD